MKEGNFEMTSTRAACFFSPLFARWREPEAFRSREDPGVSPKPWIRPVSVIIFVGLWHVGWVCAKLNSTKHPLSLLYFFPLMVVLGLFVVYGMPRIQRRLSARVVLYTKGISKASLPVKILWFNNVTEYQWEDKSSYYVLLLRTKLGQVKRYGVPDAVLRTKIEGLLRENGLNRMAESHADWAPESRVAE